VEYVLRVRSLSAGRIFDMLNDYRRFLRVNYARSLGNKLLWILPEQPKFFFFDARQYRRYCPACERGFFGDLADKVILSKLATFFADCIICL